MFRPDDPDIQREAAWLAMSRVRGVGPKTLTRLHRDNERDHRTMWQLLKDRAKRDVESPAVTEARAGLDDAVEETRRLRDRQIRVLTLEDPNYPTTFAAIEGPPLLFAFGDISLLNRSSVAIVGSRKAAAIELRAARSIATQCARSGLNVVSGYAAGIDTEAHLGALSDAGTTTIVLPTGMDEFDWKDSFRPFLERGLILVISTFPLQARWTAHGAMERNRYVCALSKVLVVVAAAREGGTMNTAETALRLGMPLFAVDFEDSSEGAEGNRDLINRGAQRLATVNGIVDASLAIEKARMSTQDHVGRAPGVQLDLLRRS